ncbi:MAG: hypothetical protein N2645_22755 [Clostridia bacterium]|nr:hypothetical protein [Clostridia bacterium]
MQNEVIRATGEIVKGVIENESVKIGFEKTPEGDVNIVLHGVGGKVTLKGLIKSIKNNLKDD